MIQSHCAGSTCRFIRSLKIRSGHNNAFRNTCILRTVPIELELDFRCSNALSVSFVFPGLIDIQTCDADSSVCDDQRILACIGCRFGVVLTIAVGNRTGQAIAAITVCRSPELRIGIFSCICIFTAGN